MSELSEVYKMTTQEYIAHAIVIRVNPEQVQGAVRLVCADSQAEQALLQLKSKFGNNPSWAQRCVDLIMAKSFQDDLLCTATPDMTPVVLLKETSVGTKSIADILTTVHLHCIVEALDAGLDVPSAVLKHFESLQERPESLA